MKSVRVESFGGPEAMVCQELPDLEPGQGQAVVGLEAAGVNPVDTYIRSGVYPRLPELPYTPGRDGAGRVLKVGPDYAGPGVGARVYLSGSLSGTYAQQVLCSAAQVHPLPDDLSMEQGAALGIPYTTAYHALFNRGKARPGERLLIHGGTGAVGLAALQMAVAAGLTVVATGGTEEGRQLLLEQGAEQALEHKNSQQGGPYDLILEMLANVNLDRDLEMLNFRGRVAIVGNRGTTTLDARKTMTRDLHILGVALANALPEELKAAHAGIGAGLRNATLRPLVRTSLPMEKAAEAHRLVLEPGARGKIVLLTR